MEDTEAMILVVEDCSMGDVVQAVCPERRTPVETHGRGNDELFSIAETSLMNASARVAVETIL